MVPPGIRSDRRPRLKSKRETVVNEKGKARVVFVREYPGEPECMHEGFNMIDDMDFIDAMAKRKPLYADFWRMLYAGYSLAEVREAMVMPERTFRRFARAAMDYAVLMLSQ